MDGGETPGRTGPRPAAGRAAPRRPGLPDALPARSLVDRLLAEGRIGPGAAVQARATALAQQGKDIINLGIGQPDFRTPEHIVEAAIKALRDGHHGYTPANGLLATREAVARRTLSMTGVEVSPEEIMIMPGGKPTMFAAILMFGEPGAQILYPDPGFPIYRSMIEFTGAEPVPVPIREENGFAFSAEETLSLITPETRLLILNSPANPTGGVTPRSEIEKLMDAETFMGASEAVEYGFADGITDDADPASGPAVSASATVPSQILAKRRIDAALAQQGISRTERRKMFNQIAGMHDAADTATHDAGFHAAAIQRLIDTIRS